jgi:outer membrane protein assembly factor BamB
VVVGCVVAAGAVTAAPASGPAGAAPPPAVPPVYSWTEVHQNPSLDGVSADPSIATTDAGRLGVSWMYGADSEILSSPVVGWNQALSQTVAYSTDEAGEVLANDEAGGALDWSTQFASPILGSPLLDGSSLWVAPSLGDRIYKLDAATGAVQCSATLTRDPGQLVESTPTIATPPGGSPTVYVGVNDSSTTNGPVVGVDESDCVVDWSTTPEPVPGTGGTWDFVGYNFDAAGEGLVLFGTADPDSSIYAVDATTGKLVWRYAAANPPPGTFDIGAGVTSSAPGVNGFADGAAYAVSKTGTMYALDLTTGALLWQFNYDQSHGDPVPDAFSTAALSGTDLVYGDLSGLDDVDAQTGALRWHAKGPAGFDSSPLIVGPAGSQVVVVGDLAGGIDAYSLATGALLSRYQTGGTITSSPAEVDGNVVVGSSDGYVYDLDLGGGTGAAPTTTVTAPAAGTTVANTGTLTVTGTATGTVPVGSVDVDVQLDGPAGRWWDGAAGTWVTAPTPNPAVLASPGADATSWSLSVPVPPGGGGITVLASAVGTNGVADISAMQSPATTSRVSATVAPAPAAPVLTTSSPWVAPDTSVTVSGSGFLAGESVTLSLGGTTVHTSVAGRTGAVAPVAVKVPTSTPFGPETLVATGTTSGRSTTAPEYVTNSWAQYHQNADKQGADPDDLVFSDQVAVGPQYLTRSWTFTAGAAVAGSVDEVDGVAYLADAGGTVYAVAVQTGVQLWSVQLPSGTGVDTTPAVTPAVTPAGVLVVGAENGTVYGLSAATGATEWSTSLGTSGVESSPTVAGADVYVGTNGGEVAALSATTGAVAWTATVGGAVTSSPAVDTATGLLVVGSSDDDVTALHLAGGSTAWTAVTGGPVVAGALVAKGGVYVGSGDGNVYDLDEATGAVVWSTPVGGPVTAAPALRGALVVVGSSDGMYYLSVTTGKGDHTIPSTSPVVGVSSAGTFVVSEFADGAMIGAKSSTTDDKPWQVTYGSALDSTPVLVNGEVLVTGEDGVLTCYTVPGHAPV